MTRELWQRYADVWSADPARREQELAACVSAQVRYTDPNVQLAGLRALSDYMAGFQRGFPGHSFRIRAVLTHHDRSVARWDQLDSAGKPVAPGLSYATHSSDGKLETVNGFFGGAESLLS